MLACAVLVSTDLKSEEAEKLAPKNDPLADTLASKVDVYDLVPDMKKIYICFKKNLCYLTSCNFRNQRVVYKLFIYLTSTHGHFNFCQLAIHTGYCFFKMNLETPFTIEILLE